MPYKVTVFLSVPRKSKNFSTFSFELETIEKVRDHVAQMHREGYWRKSSETRTCWYPPERIMKVVVDGTGFQKGYSDTDETES